MNYTQDYAALIRHYLLRGIISIDLTLWNRHKNSPYNEVIRMRGVYKPAEGRTDNPYGFTSRQK